MVVVVGVSLLLFGFMRVVQCCGVSVRGKRCTKQTSFVGNSLMSWWCGRHAKSAFLQVNHPEMLINLGNGMVSEEKVVLRETGF